MDNTLCDVPFAVLILSVICVRFMNSPPLALLDTIHNIHCVGVVFKKKMFDHKNYETVDLRKNNKITQSVISLKLVYFLLFFNVAWN